MADAAVLKTAEGNLVRVRLPSSAPALGRAKRPRYDDRSGVVVWLREQRREQRACVALMLLFLIVARPSSK